MRILQWELRKIWRLPVVIVVLIVNLLLFYLLLSDQLHYSYNEHGEMILLEDLRGLVGDTLEPEELPVARSLLEGYYADMTTLMRSDPTFAEAGLSTGQELWTVMHISSSQTDEEIQAGQRLQELATEFQFGKYLEPSDWAFWKIQALTGFLEEYARFETRAFADASAVIFYSASADRLETYAEAKAHYNLFSSRSYEDTVNFFSMCLLIVVVSLGILLLPYMTTDHQRGIPQMQWSAPAGRGVFRTQWCAAAISAGAIAILLPAIYFSLFLAHRPAYFTLMEQHIFSVLGHTHTLSFNPMFWQLIAVTGFLCVAFGLGAAAVFFFISHHSNETVSGLLKAIPAGTAVSGLGMAAIFMLFSEQNPVNLLVMLPYADIFVVALVTFTGLILWFSSLHRIDKREIMD